MADVGGIRPNSIQQNNFTPPPPAPSPSEAPAQAPTDRVLLQKADDGDRTYTRERLGDNTEVQTWKSRSGATYEVATTPEGTRFHAEIPKGLVDQPLQIVGANDGKQTALMAHPAADPDKMVKAELTPDGKILVPLQPNGPMAMFDPTTLDFGVSTPGTAQPGPNGTPMMTQALQEIVHADGGHTIKAGVTVRDVPGSMSMLTMMPTPGHRETSYVEVDDRNGQVTARQVTEKQIPTARPGVMGAIRGAMSGPASSNNAVGVVQPSPPGFGAERPTVSSSVIGVAKQGEGRYTLSGGSFMDYVKSSMNNPMSFNSPLFGWLKGRKAGATNLLAFSGNPVSLASMGAAAGPATVAAVGATIVPPGPNAVPAPPSLVPGR